MPWATVANNVWLPLRLKGRSKRETRDEVERRLRVSPTFTGENHLLVARDGAGHAVGVCWVVLFDPGTGLEAEIAELYVRPEVRSDLSRRQRMLVTRSPGG